MIFQYKLYNMSDWEDIECGHITFNVNFIYIYKQPIARELIKTFDLRQMYKMSIK